MAVAKEFHINSDNWINQGHVGESNGGSGQLGLASGTSKWYSLMHISVPNLAGSTVMSATLRVYIKGVNWTNPDHIKVDRLLNRFSGKDTWHSFATYANDAINGPNQANSGAITVNDDGSPVDIDVTDILQEAADADQFFGLLLSVEGDVNRYLYPSESVRKNKRPYLTLTYSQKPDAPTNLRPANYAGAPKPRFAWDCVPQLAFRVQISNDGTVGTLIADSGMISSGVQETDTNDDGAWNDPWGTGPGNGDTRWWRVQIKDEVGTLSDWSPWVSWEHRTMGTLAITSPATNGATVLTTTPEITWTFDHTETMWQLLVDTDSNGDAPEYDTGRQKGSDLVLQLPKGTLPDRSVTYTISLRAWDLYDRDAPGDSAYQQVKRTFVYAGSGAVAVVDSLAVSADGPAQVFDWYRAAQPDAFTIFSDDDIVIDQLDAATHLVSGDHYQYRVLRTGRGPVTQVTYQVEAHSDVNGDSTGSPTAEGITGPQGVWLVYEDSGVEVEFLGQPEIELKVTEDGATYFPLGQREPVRIVDQIRGYEGSVTGLISGNTALADFLTIKDVPPGSKSADGIGVLRLIFGRFNIPVDIGEVTVSEWPMAEGQNEFNVSFEFWQVDRPWPVTTT